MKTLSRESIQRMVTGNGVGGGSGSGSAASELASMLAGYATEDWVDENYLSIEFFSRLFQAHGKDANDQDIDVDPNDLDTTITSVESMFGFWTDYYISALGNGGDLGSAIYLSSIADVALTSPISDGQVLQYNLSTGKWTNATLSLTTTLGGLTDVLLSTPSANQVLLYDGLSQKWINSALKTINGQPIYGSGDISVGGGASGNYLPLAGGTMLGNILYNTGHGSFNVANYGGNNVDVGWDWGNKTGAGIAFRNSSYSGQSGYFILYARNGSNSSLLTGSPEGTLSFNNHLFSTSSLKLSTTAGDLYAYNYNNLNVDIGWDFDSNAGASIALRGKNYSGEGGAGAFLIIAHTDNYVKKLIGDTRGNLTWGNIKLSNVGVSVSTTLVSSDSAFSCNCSGTSQTWSTLCRLYLSTLSNNQNVTFNIGRNQSSKNEAVVGLHYAENNSNNNFVWLGMNNVDFKLIVNGNGYVGINNTSPSYQLHVDGTIYATGSVTALSDARHKDVLCDAKIGVEQIAGAPAVQFTWKGERKSEGLQVGTLAQYWQTVLPEVVMDKGGEMSMQYGVAALVSAIVTARKVVDHERRISELEKENERLRTEVEQLRLN